MTLPSSARALPQGGRGRRARLRQDGRVRHGLGADDLGNAIYAYPTFASDVKFIV